MHISSSYAKILGQKLFRTREFSRSGSKAKDGEKRGEKERLNDGNNNGQDTHGACKHAWHTQAAWANKHYILFNNVDYTLTEMSFKLNNRILQGLRVAPAAVTEHWP